MEDTPRNEEQGFLNLRPRELFLLLFALIALSMTAYATSRGIRMFLNEPYAWIGITALAVGFLALTSMVLGDGITKRKISQILFISPFFIVAVTICWVLSFASYHQQFLSHGKSDLANSETNLRQLGLFAHNANKEAEVFLEEQRALMISGDTYQNFSTEMITFADELQERDSKKDIEARLSRFINSKRNELLDQQSRLETRQRQLNAGLQQLSGAIDKAEALSNAKQSELEALRGRIEQLKIAMLLEEGDAELVLENGPVLQADGLAGQLTGAYACKRRRAYGKGGETPGTCYYELGEALKQTQSQLIENEQLFNSTLERLSKDKKSQSRQQSELIQLVSQLKRDQLKSSEGFAAEFSSETTSFLQSLSTLLDAPSEPAFQEMASHCRQVTDTLAELDVSFDLPNCAPQSMVNIFKQFSYFEEAQQQVQAACDESQQREEIIQDLRVEMRGLEDAKRVVPISQSYDRMRSEVLETCFVGAEAIGADTFSIRDDLNAVYDRINPSQDPISQAIGKTASLFDGTASARDYFPALLALLQELSLLLSKLFWDMGRTKNPTSKERDFDFSDIDLDVKEDDPASVLAAKNLMLNATFQKQSSYLLQHTFDEEYSSQMQRHMGRILDNLYRKKQASKAARGIVITEEGMADIANIIIKHHKISLAPDPVDNKEVEEPADTAPQIKQRDEAKNVQVDVPAQLNPAPLQKGEPETSAEPEETFPTERPNDPDEPEAKIEPIRSVAGRQRQRKRRPVVVRPDFRREI